jgi:hypothetical protein
LTDEIIEASGLPLDSIEGLGRLVPFPVSSELQGDGQAGERRSQLMRHIS